MKKLLTFFIFLIFILTSYTCVFAENNPTGTANNKFGIHITDEKDLNDAAGLVNSSGGDWGYVTVVITESERNHDRWQKVFDEARKLHLIPIVRIASKAEGDNWTVPQHEEINNWVAFLNSLNWVIQNRYVIIGNEPNHSNEWGGDIDPEAYASYLKEFSKKLNEASDDFFVLPGGIDASAANTASTMDEYAFLRRMLAKEPNLFENLDGFTSHSYPNPGFSGKETDTGRGSIETYKWELSLLENLGVTKSLPVFITETGWSNKEIEASEISRMYKYAFESVWNDPAVVAVTPFTLNYPNDPFAEFSWKKSDGSFYPFFKAYQEIPKTTGDPVQIESGQIIGALAQPILFADSNFVGAVLARNTGQSIWKTDDLQITGDSGDIIIKNSLLFDIEPVRTGLIVFSASSSQEKGILLKSIYLANEDGKRITNSFPVEAVIVKGDKTQIGTLFEKIRLFLLDVSR